MTLDLAAEFKHAALTNTLRQCALFADMPAPDLNELAAITVPKALRRGEYLFVGNTPVDGIYVVQTGAIKLHRLNVKGHEQVFHVFRAGESLGEEMILADGGYHADASAVEDSRVLLVQKNGFRSLLNTQRGLALRLLRSAGQRVASLIELVDDLTFKDADTRLANWLVHQCADPDSEEPACIELQTSKRLLALELGLASETLSRTLNKLHAAQLIDVHGRSLTLPCPARLAEFVRRKTEWPVDVEGSWPGAPEVPTAKCRSRRVAVAAA